MIFNSLQANYQSFRDIFATQTSQILVWAGSGISAPANLPTWPQLKRHLLGALQEKIAISDEKDSRSRQIQYNHAESESSGWLSFQILRNALGETSYREGIRRAFINAPNCPPPEFYTRMWRLGVKGVLTTNIDRFCSRAHADVCGNKPLAEFSGNEAGDYLAALKGSANIIANLHGVLEKESSWVFTHDDLKRLVTPAYRTFISTCISTRVLLFVGISADDEAVSGHFKKLKNDGVDFGRHYWLTHRNDSLTDQFAEEHGLLRIHYSPDTNGSHLPAVDEFLTNLAKYKAPELPSPIVVPNVASPATEEILTPDLLVTKSADEIRRALNTKAAQILNGADDLSAKQVSYENFLSTYDECIYRAWRVSDKSPNNRAFGYEILEMISQGGFGKVYKAKAPSGEIVAIKVLLEGVRESNGMLDSFRRGVHAMELLSKKSVNGIVPYRDSWEIPACTVMDYIEGHSLEEAVEMKFINEWPIKLKIALDIVSIIRRAHGIPEHVLHRDVRPANIMLRGFYSPDDQGEWEVVVLDFDLCWHRDAVGNSIDLESISKAYHAPEQSGLSHSGSRRSALVDSFGVGMTLYFLVTGKHPLPQQGQYKNWDADLVSQITRYKSKSWRSLARRFARIIEWGTQFEQERRWDLTRIAGELSELQNCELTGLTRSPDHLAEEIAARCPMMSGGYEWNPDAMTAKKVSPTGMVVTLAANPSTNEVIVQFDWLGDGTQLRATVQKYILPQGDKVIALLKKGGWKTSPVSRGAMELHISASISVLKVTKTETITLLADALSRSMEELGKL